MYNPYQTDSELATNEYLANCHLIAVAPEMYEIINGLTTVLAENPSGGNLKAKRKKRYDKIQELWERGLKVLKKARGEVDE